MNRNDEPTTRHTPKRSRRRDKSPSERDWTRLESLIEQTFGGGPADVESGAPADLTEIRSRIFGLLVRHAEESEPGEKTAPSQGADANVRLRKTITAGPWPRAQDRARLG